MPGLFTEVRGETVWKMAEGVLIVFLGALKEAEKGFIAPLSPQVAPRTEGYPEFPNSFGR
jgi:hypothetical protein